MLALRRLADAVLARLPARAARSLLVRTLLVGPTVLTLRSWLRLLVLLRLSDRAAERLAARHPLIGLRVRAWGGAVAWIRPGSSDREAAVAGLLAGFHLPPPTVRDLGTVLDLGANIGLTVADFAHRHPRARVLGVEMDPANVTVAVRNIAHLGERAAIRQAAVWTTRGELAYGGDQGDWAFRLEAAMDPQRGGELTGRTTALTLPDLLDELAPGGHVDFMKVDVEGTERFLFADPEPWAERVAAMQVEIHRPYTVEQAAADLTGAGFTVTSLPGNPTALWAFRER